METINNWTNIMFDSLKEMTSGISEAIPNIIGALLVLIFGWLLTKLVIYLLKRFLKLVKADIFMDNLKQREVFGTMNLNFQLSNVIAGIVKFIMLLIFLTVALEILNWHVISQEIGNLLRYLPKLLSAIILFSIGLYIANFVRKAIAGFFGSFDMVGSKIISQMVYYIIVIIITVTALNQASIDTTIITNNLTLLLGAFLVAFAIAFGLGSKDVIQKLLFSFYSNKKYEVGQTIVINGTKGEILSIDNICVTLKTTTGQLTIPIQEFVESRVEIIEEIP
ncbi:MAG: mechanosensitive ion channel [Gelidibacter sp.]